MTETTTPQLPRIIAVNRFYRPDISATAQLLSDLMEHLASDGRRVIVVTSRLTYDAKTDERLEPLEDIAGVTVRRVWTSQFGRHRLIGRAIDYLTFYVSSFFALLSITQKGDIVLAKTDPPLISVIAWIAAGIRGARLINWCQDLFPEVGEVLGLKWAGGPVGRALRTVRNWSLKGAVFNAVLDETMAERLILEGIPRHQIRVLPNWADRDIRPVPREINALRKEWGLTDAFVVGYSGNLGRAHLPDEVAALVSATRDLEWIHWVFIGGGAGLDKVRSAAAGARNVQFRPYQPRDRLSESLSVPDLHLITLDPECEGLIVPSKLYGVQAVGRPVLFVGDPSGAVAKQVVANDAGEVFSPFGNASDEFILRLSDIQKRSATLVTSNALSHSDGAWRLSAKAGLQEWANAVSTLPLCTVGARLRARSPAQSG